MEAGNLKPGEHVVTLSGASGTATATVAWVHVVAGRADMYNLTVASDHTYAVGDGQYVVHNITIPNVGDTWGGPGSWQPPYPLESMSARSALYQEGITGVPARVWVYMVDGVKFDGYDRTRGVLLDAKGPGYNNFFDANGNPQYWWGTKTRGFPGSGMVDEAERQIAAAGNTPIEWHVQESDAAQNINVLNQNGVTGITVRCTP